MNKPRNRLSRPPPILRSYAAHLRAAGVPVTSVCYLGTIHDFVMLKALRDIHAAKAATAQAVSSSG
jgi:acetyl esterase/lipase